MSDYRHNPLSHGWKIAVYDGLRDLSIDTWVERLMAVVVVMGPGQCWVLGGETLETDPTERIRAEVEKRWVPVGSGQRRLVLMCANSDGTYALGIGAEIAAPSDQVHGNIGDLMWPMSELAFSVYSVAQTEDLPSPRLQEYGRTPTLGEMDRVRDHVARFLVAANPVHGYLHGDDAIRLMWPEEDVDYLRTGGLWFGIPQVGWLTYLRTGQFPPVPAELEHGIVHNLGVGQLIELRARPWLVGDRETMLAHALLRQELLDHRIIRPAVDAAQDRETHWKRAGATPEHFIPKDAGVEQAQRSLEWKPTPIEDDPWGSSDNDDDSEDDDSWDSDDDDSLDDNDDSITPPSSQPAARGSVPTPGAVPLGDLDSTQALDVKSLELSPNVSPLPFVPGTGKAPEPRIVTRLAPNPLDVTAEVDLGRVRANVQDMPAHARPLPFSVDDYARLVADTEPHAPAHEGHVRTKRHQAQGIGDEAHRAHVDGVFDAHFQDRPNDFDVYCRRLDHWRVELRKQR